MQITGSQSWTSEEQILVCSGICLEASYGKPSWRDEGSWRADWLRRITSLMLKNGPSPYTRSHATVAGGLYGWRRNSWLNSNIRKTRTGGGSRNRCPGISRDTVQAYNDRVRKVKAYLGKDLKGKKGFHRYISSKRKSRENVILLLNGTGDLMTKVLEKTEVLSPFFTLVFTGKIFLQESHVTEIRGKVWSNKDPW